MYNSIGIDAASMTYYGKEIEDLDQDELLGIVAMIFNPSLYNPKRQAVISEKKINELKILLEQKNQ